MADPTVENAVATERRWPLHIMIFILTGLMIVLAVGFSVGLNWWQGARLADDAVEAALGRARSAQDEFQRLRFRQLELVTDVLAGDPPFVAYVNEAMGADLFGNSTGVDQASLRDELADRRSYLGFDLALIFDATGTLVAHSERPVGNAEDMSVLPLIGEAVRDLVPVSGLWHEGRNVYQLAVVPLEVDFSLIGFVATGLLIDDVLANEVKQVSGTEILWLAGSDLIASTLDAESRTAVVAALSEQSALTRAAESDEPVTAPLEVDGNWIARIINLQGGADEPVLSVSLINLDRVLAGFRGMRTAMIAAGALTVILAMLFSLAIAKRVTGPLTRLAAAAKDAEQGDFSASFEDAKGSAEIQELSHSFGSLLRDLKEKRDMEQYVSDLSRYLPDPAVEDGRTMATEGALEPATRRDLVLLAVELREDRADSDQSFEEAVRVSEQSAMSMAAIAKAHSAQLELFTGQRALFSAGDSVGASRILTIAGQLSGMLGTSASMAMVAGPISRASIRLEGKVHRLILGKAVMQADLLLEEAPPGSLLVAPSLKESISTPLEEFEATIAVGRGRLSGRRYLSLDQGSLGRIETATSERTVAFDDDTAELTPATAATARTVATGDLFANRFEIVSVLGRGGMGVVYKAYDRELEDFVALKTLLPEIADNQKYLEQLKEEIRLARRITHPNVLRTYDFGQYGNSPFISMEYVRGMTLRYLLEQRRRLPYSAALRVARQLASGLAVAHSQDVIHRDIKPENLILEANGNAKLMDFGIASPMERMRDSEGLFVGTPTYAAPEQMEGKALDARADIYACGVLMYEMFCGERPMPVGTMMDVYSAKVDEKFPAPDTLEEPLPYRLSSIIMRCMRARANERYEDAAALEQALRGARNV